MSSLRAFSRATFAPLRAFQTCPLVQPFSTAAAIAAAAKEASVISIAMVDTEPQATSAPSTCNPKASTETSASVEKPLPKLTPSEFRQYNHMAEHMDYFHNMFRATWTSMMTACETGTRPKGMSIKQFLAMGQQFVHHLTMHHKYEEKYVFPGLAKKMPAFRKELELLSQHKEIHKGLEKLDEYLEACRTGERELRLNELKEILDSFGEVLWQHLDDEVKELGAENMRKYWTLDEMRKLQWG